jgi:TP53 regulating kinase-like protein
MTKTIQQGAEAIISLFEDNKIITKSRIPKSYRLPYLDKKIRKLRTRRESKILEKASKIIPVPKLISSSEKNTEIKMQYIKGKKLSKSLDSLNNKFKIIETLGIQIAKLHNSGIIHGDLTTSNLILEDSSKKLFFIDFGLSYHSDKIEDKAVDLHLIKQALEAKHPKNHKEYFKSIIKGYKLKNKNSKEVLERLKKVELRGRYKQQY